MLSIIKLAQAIAVAENTTQPREQALAVSLTLAKDALARANEKIHRFGARWIARRDRMRTEELLALTLAAELSDCEMHSAVIANREADRVAAFDKAREEAAASDAACYAAQDEAERWEEERMQANCNGRIY